jgi:hypothetical protein
VTWQARRRIRFKSQAHTRPCTLLMPIQNPPSSLSTATRRIRFMLVMTLLSVSPTYLSLYLFCLVLLLGSRQTGQYQLI